MFQKACGKLHDSALLGPLKEIERALRRGGGEKRIKRKTEEASWSSGKGRRLRAEINHRGGGEAKNRLREGLSCRRMAQTKGATYWTCH